MKRILPLKTLPVKRVRFLVAALILPLIAAYVGAAAHIKYGRLLAGAPTISYTSPHTYVVNAAIPSLAPASNGVGAFGTYSAQQSIGSGFVWPSSVAVDAVGNVFVADFANNVIKEVPVNGSGIITVTSGYAPGGIAIDGAGVLYVSDYNHGAVKKIIQTTAGTFISTIATGFTEARAITVDANGNVYVADTYENTVKMIPVAGGPPVVVGSGFNAPSGLAVDAAGNLFVVDFGNNLVKEVPAGTNTPITIGVGIDNPHSVAVDNDGNVYVSDRTAGMKIITPTGAVVPAGVGTTSVTAISVNSVGKVYIADAVNKRVSTITPQGGYFINTPLPNGLHINPATGVISGTAIGATPATDYYITVYNATGNAHGLVNITTVLPPPPSVSYPTQQVLIYGDDTYIAPTVAGVAPPAYGKAVPVSTGNTVFTQPVSLNIDAAGNLYVSDSTATSLSRIPAGGGTPVIIGNSFSKPCSSAIDATGNIYVASKGDNSIKKIPSGGNNPGVIGFGFSKPTGVAVDAAGNVYVVDSGNHAIKKIGTASNTPVTLLTSTNIQNFSPSEIVSDAAGNLFVTDIGNKAVVKIEAGTGARTTLGLGAYTEPAGIAIDAADNVFVADYGNNSVKMLAYPYDAPVIAVASNLTGPYGVAADGKGNVFIAEPGSHLIKQVTPLGGFYMSRALPGGLHIDRTTGIISGTTNEVTAVKNDTIAVYNNYGHSFVVINLEVRKVAPAVISYTSPQTYGVGTNITPPGPQSIGVDAPGYGLSTVFASGLNAPSAVAIDGAGNLYEAEQNNGMIKMFPADGSRPHVIGSGFVHPNKLAVDGTGNVYVYDINNNAIKKIAADGITVTPVFLNVTIRDLAADYAGNLYFSDVNYKGIRKLPAGSTTATSIPGILAAIGGITVDGLGNVYFGDYDSSSLYEIPADGSAIQLFASSVKGPAGLAVDNAGNIYELDDQLMTIQKIKRNGHGTPLGSGWVMPSGIAIDKSGRLYVSDKSNGAVSLIAPTGGYFISPELPKGLSFSTETGAINGIPATENAATNYTVNGWNAGGSTAAVFNMKIVTVNDIATLSNLKLSAGTLSPVFAAATATYTASVANTVASITLTPTISSAGETVKVNGLTVASATPSGAIALSPGQNVINTVVTALDGTTTKTYTITVTRALPSGSSNAVLSILKITPATPLTTVTGSDYKDYTTTVPATQTSVKITPTAQDATAIIKVNGVVVASGTASASIPLSGGATVVKTVVTAQDGVTVKTYSITFNRQASNNAVLSLFKLTPASPLTTVTGSDYKDYTTTVPATQTSLTITPTAQDATAAIKVNGVAVASGTASASIPLGGGATVIKTVVTAQDGVTVKTYSLTVTRAASNNAVLTSIKITPATPLTTVTGSDYKDYTTSVPNSETTVKITPTVQDATATIKVKGVTVASGTASASIPLSVGDNVINTVVTAQDGLTTKTYSIKVTRAPATMMDAYQAPDSVKTASDDIKVPQGLSPNGDGVGDVLVIDGITAYPDNTFQVINRSGVLVYSVKGYDNVSKVFDGQSNINGKMQQPGTYFYRLEYTADGKAKFKTGFIVIKY